IDGWSHPRSPPPGPPPQAEAGKSERPPAVLEIHGGPMAMYSWSFFFEFQLLASHGYAVVLTNPRGSTGYGRAFSAAVNGDWGGKDFQDIMAGIDAAVLSGWVDPDRLGVAGGSYGGYMTNWTVGHTDRFKAAVIRARASSASAISPRGSSPTFEPTRSSAKASSQQPAPPESRKRKRATRRGGPLVLGSR